MSAQERPLGETAGPATPLGIPASPPANPPPDEPPQPEAVATAPQTTADSHCLITRSPVATRPTETCASKADAGPDLGADAMRGPQDDHPVTGAERG
jgi:hypothetical protein